MDRPFRIESLFFGLSLTLASCSISIVGCGGGASEPTSTAPSSDSSTMVPPSSSGLPGIEEAPPKELKNGMTLPDEVPINPLETQDSGKSTGPGNGKGMQLPDDLVPTTSWRSSQETSTTLVSTRSREHSVDVRFATWDQLLSVASSTGKVTVVDLWSLSCTPCLKKFPELVDLKRRYPDQIEAIGANADFDGREKFPPACYREDVERFLDTVEADFPNFILETPCEDLHRNLGIASLPAVFVFSSDGKLVKRFCDVGATKGFTYQDDIMPLVERLLK